ncbi:proteasome PCI domain-containing protein, putative [Eimeria necatrix]|uniref:Proteasome PCI domain-containing protein, putative n=1 Tax=Eimeria necatrix TaxID=51315 RepID=U6MX91_9EIME|nr:proteasome PCI domain-containing protein, putative [Eimeria necatrix]CDJ68882.1 proteasome PCI domain-containing protein, putative [Eimeria necatrix]
MLADARPAGKLRAGRWPRATNQQTESWVSRMLQAVSERNGEAFSELIRHLDSIIPDEEIANMPETVMTAIVNTKLKEASLPKAADTAFKRLFFSFLKLRQLRCTLRWGDVVRQCISVLDLYVDLYVGAPAASCSWLVPGLAALCTIMSRAAFAADSSSEDSADLLEEAEGAADTDEMQHRYTKQILNAIRPKLGKVRGEEARHGAYVVLLGQSIKRCLQLGNMQMAAGFLKLCDSRQINFSHAPRGPMVNFRYYLGRLYMQQEQFEQSESELVWAFSNCPPTKMRVRRNILECLVAARLRMGKLPSAELLNKYQMPHYLDIIKAMKSGNLSLFDRALEQHESVFIKHGTILCVERLKFIVFRTLMKRMKQWWLESGLASKANIVPIQVFTAAIKWQSDELFDDDEMACISANLIRMGYIKGYISWEHMVIVFSNQEPFPSLKTSRGA